jgi:hypothetical protein
MKDSIAYCKDEAGVVCRRKSWRGFSGDGERRVENIRWETSLLAVCRRILEGNQVRGIEEVWSMYVFLV